ncbi:hypothetical protein BY458DRAFT_527864 [Sporodiniella umbellata]|nr:hypothetical protein BY458DRAFT_527864 [Sporodiniella umbellata]
MSTYRAFFSAQKLNNAASGTSQIFKDYNLRAVFAKDGSVISFKSSPTKSTVMVLNFNKSYS